MNNMSESSTPPAVAESAPVTSAAATRSAAETQKLVEKSLRRRYRAEQRFRAYGLAAVLSGIIFVVFLFGTILMQGVSVFQQSYVKLEVFYDPEIIDPTGERDPDVLVTANYQSLVRDELRERFPDVSGRRDTRELYRILSSAASLDLQQRVVANPLLIGQRETRLLLVDDNVDMLLKDKVARDAPEEARRLTDQQLAWVETLEADGILKLRFNRSFFSNGD